MQILAAKYWIFSSVAMSFCRCGDHIRAAYSKGGCTRDTYSGHKIFMSEHLQKCLHQSQNVFYLGANVINVSSTGNNWRCCQIKTFEGGCWWGSIYRDGRGQVCMLLFPWHQHKFTYEYIKGQVVNNLKSVNFFLEVFEVHGQWDGVVYMRISSA